MAKKSSTSKKAPAAARTRRARSDGPAPAAEGKHLVIVESPAKAKTINKYLGPDYVVMASVGHVRDLPSRPPKGVKQEVPGVDLEHDFQPTYEVMPDKKDTVAKLKKTAKAASDIWFATDLDREGEAIAWHLAQALDVDVSNAKRVVFNAITKADIQNAFSKPRPINEAKVNAQQARRILDRIVGYKVSPLLWRKVASGLSAGRVQSVAVRLVVEREREIEAFIPEEHWKITATLAAELAKAPSLAKAWREFLASKSDGNDRTVKEKIAWLGEHACIQAELTEFQGKPFEALERVRALDVARQLGFVLEHTQETEDPKGKGPAKHLVAYQGRVENAPTYRIRSIETRRTTSRASAPFITSTLQQAAANQLSYPAVYTMRLAQQLYEGVELGNLGSVGLITYMRTDSTHLSGEAIGMARNFIQKRFGDNYLPEKPNFFSSSNKAAQEAHEAIRPTDVTLTPDDPLIQRSLSPQQHKLYKLIWQQFVACQMANALWDSTAILIEAGERLATFKANGRKLVFDGFLKVTGIPAGDPLLPDLREQQPLAPLQLDPSQHFSSPPPRYSDASLIKKLESEGIGRPSTYASIIQVIQDRKYVEKRNNRFHATDLGKVVNDKLMEAIPEVLDVGYTRQMESELDKIEDDHKDWVRMLHEFYGPFNNSLVKAYGELKHAKAEMQPAPHTCAKCGAGTVYRFGRNGRFLSCSRYPDCDYASPIDTEGNPITADVSDIACPSCGTAMVRRTGRFGPFLSCGNYPECKGIVKLEPKKGTVVLPKPPPLTLEDLPCPKCQSPLNLRRSKRGPWLSCSKYPKCRGRLAWTAVEPARQQQLEEALAKHEQANPTPVIRTITGETVAEGYVPKVSGAQGDSDSQAASTEMHSDAA